jgi:hypothetical protein
MPRNENGGALPEGSATAVSADTGSIRASDTAEDSTERIPLEVRVWRLLMDFRAHRERAAESEAVERYREAQESGDVVLCASCGLFPAAYRSRCFTCLATDNRTLIS